MAHHEKIKWSTLENPLLLFGTTYFSPLIEKLCEWPIIVDYPTVGMLQFDAQQKFLSKTLLSMF